MYSIESLVKDSGYLIAILYILAMVLGILTYSTLPLLPIYITGFIVYGLIMLVFIIFYDTQVATPTYAVISLGVLCLIYIYHAITNPFGGESYLWYPIVRTPYMIFLLIINVFIIPKIINIEKFFRVVIILTTFVSILGIINLFIGDFSIGSLSIARHKSSHGYHLTSVFVGPNGFSRFALAGSIMSLTFLYVKQSPYHWLPFIINFSAIYLAYSRATIGALLIGVVLFFTYAHYHRKLFYLISTGLGVSGFFLIGMMFNIVPGPERITSISPSGRGILWRASIEAARDNLFLGRGPGDTGEYIRQYIPPVEGQRWIGNHPHSSYFRMLLTTGLLGTLAYVYFLIRSIWIQSRISESIYSISLLSIAIAYLINQITASFSIFGLGAPSIVSSTVFGYLLHNIVIHQYDKNK